MKQILLTLCSLSLSGSLLILLLLLLKPLLRKHLGHSIPYYLWLIPLLRLLLPIFPWGHLFHPLFSRPQAPELEAVWFMPPDMAIAGAPAHALPSPVEVGPTLPLTLICFLLWISVAFCLLIRTLWGYVRCLNSLRHAGYPANPETQAAYDTVCHTLKLRHPPTLLVCPSLRSPMQAGIFHPMILLPTDRLDAANLSPIFFHELTHYRQLDSCYKWLVEVATCLHWFNPLVYVMRREVTQTCELSCDERVLHHLDPSGRLAYGATILSLARPISPATPHPPFTFPISEDGKQLKERLELIMIFGKIHNQFQPFF